MKTQLLAIFLIVGSVQANEWWDPLGLLTSGSKNQPILAQLSPAVHKSVPVNIQRQLAKLTPRDLLGLHAMVGNMTIHPPSRAEFIKELNAKAPNVLFLGTEIYKVSRSVVTQSRKRLSSESVRFIRIASKEAAAAVNEAANLFNKQNVITKKNLLSVFPCFSHLIHTAQRSVQYVAKNV